jgi:sulfur carrier protein ThiS
MKVFINFSSSLLPSAAAKVDNRSNSIDVKEGTTIFELLTELKVPLDDAALFILNGIPERKDHVLKEGDRVGIIAAVSGG